MPEEYIDFDLIRNVYHCTPAELEEQDFSTIFLHREILRVEAEKEKKRKLTEIFFKN